MLSGSPAFRINLGHILKLFSLSTRARNLFLMQVEVLLQSPASKSWVFKTDTHIIRLVIISRIGNTATAKGAGKGVGRRSHAWS